MVHKFYLMFLLCASCYSVLVFGGTEKNESVYCESGETFASNKNPEEFSSENLSCKKVPGTQVEGACNTTRIESSTFDGDSFSISCGDNGYLEGYDVFLENGDFSGSFIFIYYCCENKNETLIRNSCMVLDETAPTFKLQERDIINRVGLIFNTTSGDYSVNITLCRLESLTPLETDTYDMYEAGSETKYGNSSKDYSYTSTCFDRDNGSIVTKIDSVWSGPPSYDRGFRVICSNLYNDLDFPVEIGDSARRRVDMPEPFPSSKTSWTGGCRDNEILVGINSYLDTNSTRRYEFLCYDYISLQVMEETCKFRSPELWLDHSIKTFQDGSGIYAFRGVRATYVSTDIRPKDRNFEYEICMVKNTTEAPLARKNACSFNVTTEGASVDSPIREAVFIKYRTEDVHECARMCSAHPFCHSFAWDPTMDDPSLWTCELSYYESTQSDACEDETDWISEFRAEQIITVECFKCQTQPERGDQLFCELELNKVLTK